MSGDLSPMRGAAPEPAFGTRMTRQVKRAVKEGLEADAKGRVIGYVGARAMTEMAYLDDRRKYLAAGDPALNAALFEIELVALKSYTRLQGGLFNGGE